MRELEIYIHIPFCVQKCRYCDFLSGPGQREEQKAYVDALKLEIQSGAQMGAGYVVRSIFLGGGTPSILSAEEIRGILFEVGSSFYVSTDAEVTMEMNPGTFDRKSMVDYLKSGVNRLSIGLQSADDGELRTLGRIHTWSDFLRTYDAARDAGFSNVNIDLMSAVPGQTLESYEKTLNRVCGLSPEHISAYSLIIEEGTPFWHWYEESDHLEGYPPLPDEETERKMYERTKAILGEYGYRRYEISNYAKRGRECIHNIGYWKRVPYLGFGVGAASFLGECRWSNIRDRRHYIEVWKKMQSKEAATVIKEEIQQLSVCEAQEETFFLGLRMMEGVSEEEFAQRFGRTVDEIYGNVLYELEKENLIVRKQGRIFLSERGIDVSNSVMACFLQDNEEGKND